jgi:hypothetical protein
VQPPFVDFTVNFTLRHAQQLVAPTRADPLLIDVLTSCGRTGSVRRLAYKRRTGSAAHHVELGEQAQSRSRRSARCTGEDRRTSIPRLGSPHSGVQVQCGARHTGFGSAEGHVK